jgi:hypothetical protein
MRGYGGWILALCLAAAGYYAFAVNPTLYQVDHMGPHTYRRNRLTNQWQIKRSNGWKDIKGKPNHLDPSNRLGEVGIRGF